MERVEANAINKLGRARHIPDSEISRFAGFDRAGFAKDSEGSSGLARCSGKRFPDCETEQCAGHVHRQKQGGERGRARIAVGSDSHANACVTQDFDGRRALLAQCIKRSGQKHGDGSGRGHGLCAVFVEIFEMIGRKRAIRCGQFCAAKIGKLFRMELYRKTKGFRLVKHKTYLRGRERYAFAEAVHGIHQPFGMGSFKSGENDLGNIVISAASKFRRDRMGREIAGKNTHWSHRTETARGAQHLQFGFNVEPVTGFDLDGRDTFTQQGVQPRQALRNQFILAQGIGRLDRGNDTASGTRNRLIARALQSHFELARPIAAIDQMSMAIYQGWRHQPVSKVDRPDIVIRAGWNILFRSGKNNAPVLHEDRSTLDNRSRIVLTRNQTGIAPELATRARISGILRNYLSTHQLYAFSSPRNMYRHN